MYIVSIYLFIYLFITILQNYQCSQYLKQHISVFKVQNTQFNYNLNQHLYRNKHDKSIFMTYPFIITNKHIQLTLHDIFLKLFVHHEENHTYNYQSPKT